MAVDIQLSEGTLRMIEHNRALAATLTNRLLVLGDWRYDHFTTVWNTLDTLHKAWPIGMLITRGWNTGPSLAVTEWAHQQKMRAYHWLSFGVVEEHEKDLNILTHTRPEVMLAFPPGPVARPDDPNWHPYLDASCWSLVLTAEVFQPTPRICKLGWTPEQLAELDWRRDHGQRKGAGSNQGSPS